MPPPPAAAPAGAGRSARRYLQTFRDVRCGWRGPLVLPPLRRRKLPLSSSHVRVFGSGRGAPRRARLCACAAAGGLSVSALPAFRLGPATRGCRLGREGVPAEVGLAPGDPASNAAAEHQTQGKL
ncbi:hypothetical protein NQZ68_040509 [Dissostichus eleginoides]|nr:hypothetical protein NQZ68_040509 [Dissostichus eleginoides]